MWTLRLVASRGGGAPVSMRDSAFDTKAEVWNAIRALGKLSRIDRFGHIYAVTPKAK
jgi:hypothetical protein